MTHLNSEKRGVELYRRHKGETRQVLRDAYKSWSDEKEKAYNYCRAVFKELDGRDFKIIAASNFVFSVTFLFRDNEDVRRIAYITRDYDRSYPISDEL